MQDRTLILILGFALTVGCATVKPKASAERFYPRDRVVCADWKEAPSAWYVDASFYEIFVRSFQDSDGDGIGDFDGLIERLDYLNDGDPSTQTDLGVSALWLMPINPSPSYHGYDVTDYRAIAAEYGGMDAFRRFLKAAHARGIRVVMDLVVNHTSSQHPWFVKGKRGPQNSTFDYYHFRDSPLDWTQPWNTSSPTWHPIGKRYFYGLFWGGMPDLNFKNPAVRREMLDVAEYWLELGIDGFRLDAARYLVENGKGLQADQPGTHRFWRSLRKLTNRHNGTPLLVGEAWTDNKRAVEYFGNGDELHMLFGFDRASGLRRGISSHRASILKDAICEELDSRPAVGWFGSFATNHDMDRIATILGATSSVSRLALVGKLLFTMPGTPFIYYGQELGLLNGPGQGDPEKRMPMRWDDGNGNGFTSAATAWAMDDKNQDTPSVARQINDPKSLFTVYRQMAHLRSTVPALRRGATVVIDVGYQDQVLAFARILEGDLVLIVANVADEPVSLTLPLGALGWGELKFTGLVGTHQDPHAEMRMGAADVSIWHSRD